MKKFFLLILLTTLVTTAQEYKLEQNTITGVFDIKDKTKAEIFASVNKWVSINYNSAKNVVQMNDIESGTIIIKGINEISYINSIKALNPKSIYVEEYLKNKFNHLVEINIKDNKIRIIFKLTDMISTDINYNSLNFNSISFDKINESEINEYNDKMEPLLKKAFIGKEKREKFKTLTRPMFEDFNNNLINDIKTTMQSIEKSIIETTKDKW